MGLFFHGVHIDSGMPGVEIAFLNARAVRLQAIEQLDKRFPTFVIGTDDLAVASISPRVAIEVRTGPFGRERAGRGHRLSLIRTRTDWTGPTELRISITPLSLLCSPARTICRPRFVSRSRTLAVPPAGTLATAAAVGAVLRAVADARRHRCRRRRPCPRHHPGTV